MHGADLDLYQRGGLCAGARTGHHDYGSAVAIAIGTALVFIVLSVLTGGWDLMPTRRRDVDSSGVGR